MNHGIDGGTKSMKSSSTGRGPRPASLQLDLSGVPHCSRCRTVGYRGERYCPHCGDPMLGATIAPMSLGECTYCGEEIRHPVTYYCTACGRATGKGEGSRE